VNLDRIQSTAKVEKKVVQEQVGKSTFITNPIMITYFRKIEWI
jgi:hypothetical protein